MLYLQYEEADPLVNGIIGILLQRGRIRIDDTLNINSVRNRKTFYCMTFSGTTNDICLMADAHHFPAEPLLGKVARRVGIVRRAEKFQFDPAVYDTLLVFSRYTKDTITKLYPRIKNRVHLCCLPFDPFFRHDSTSENNCSDIVFIQTFSAESMHLLEVYLGGLLVKLGFRVSHLFCAVGYHHFAETEKSLMQEGENRGMEFEFLPHAEAYYTRLGQAGVVVALDWRACPSHLLAAAALGVVPVAPLYGAYPEHLPRANLYPPLNTEEILAMVHSPPVGRICWERHDPRGLVLEFLQKAGI